MTILVVLLTITAGCTAVSFDRGNENPIPTEEPKQTPIPTVSETQSPTPTETVPDTKSDEMIITTPEAPDRGDKYGEFDALFLTLIRDFNITIANSGYDSENKSYTVRYQLTNPSNRTLSMDERRTIAFGYAFIVEKWNSDEFPDKDHTWIPDTVNITAETPDGRTFTTSHIKYLWAYKETTGRYSTREYILLYEGSFDFKIDPDEYREGAKEDRSGAES